MTIGERIRKLRTAQGWSQATLAKKIFVTKQAVSRWEKNETIPKADNLERLQKVLHVSMAFLLIGENASPDTNTASHACDSCCVDVDLAVEYTEFYQGNTRSTLKIILLSMTLLIAGLCAAWITDLYGDWMATHPIALWAVLVVYLALTGTSIWFLHRAPHSDAQASFSAIESDDFYLTDDASSLVTMWKLKYESLAHNNSSIGTLGIMGLMLWYLDTAFDNRWQFSVESTIFFLVGLTLIIAICMPLAQHWYAIRKLLHEAAPPIPTPFNRDFWRK